VDRINIRGLNAAGVATGWATLRNTAGSTLLDLRAYQEAWLRLYGSESDYLLDAARTIDVLPPTTPIIVDVLFPDSSPQSALPVSPAGFVAGPGCTNAADFPLAVDGDVNTAWSAGNWFVSNGQTVGDTFAVDMGAPYTFLTIKMGMWLGAFADYPETASVETSTDGAAWTMRIASFACSPTTIFTLAAVVVARYIRIKIVTVRVPASEWSIDRFVVSAPPALSAPIRLFDGDETGIKAFNWNNPATNQLYYALKVLNPTKRGLLYTDTFDQYTPVCTIREWYLSDTGGTHVIFGPATTNVSNCDLLNANQPTVHRHTPWLAAQYIDTGSARPRFYYDNYQLRGETGATSIGRFRTVPLDRSITGFLATVVRGITLYDPPNWAFSFFAYLLDSPTIGAWDTKGRLSMGIRRVSAGDVALDIEWTNDANVSASLGTVALAFPANSSVELQGFVTRLNIGAVNESVQATLYFNGVLRLTAEVPQALLNIPGHRGVGIGMANTQVPDAPAAEPDWGLAALTIYGADTGVNIDIGHVPVERPGGSLVHTNILQAT